MQEITEGTNTSSAAVNRGIGRSFEKGDVLTMVKN